MSTRSRIGYVNDKGQYVTAYCHWDGYVEYTGVMLFTHYRDLNKVKKLVDGGSFSSIKDEPDAVSRYEYEAPLVFDAFSELIDYMNKSDQEYLYIFENGEWAYYANNTYPYKFEYMGTIGEKEEEDV